MATKTSAPTHDGPRSTHINPLQLSEHILIQGEHMKNHLHNENDLAESIALFRYGLIANIVRDPPRTNGVYRRLRQIAQREHVIPGSSRNKIAMETIRKWVSKYRTQGFSGLYPKRRQDHGRARKLSQDVVDGLLDLKEKNPALSVKQIINQARHSVTVQSQFLFARPAWQLAGYETDSTKIRSRDCQSRLTHY